MARARSMLPQTIRRIIVAVPGRSVRVFVCSVHTQRDAPTTMRAVSVPKVLEPDCCKTIITQVISHASRPVIVRASTAVKVLRAAIRHASRPVIVRASTAEMMLRAAISHASRPAIVRASTAAKVLRAAISHASRQAIVRVTTAVKVLRAAISSVRVVSSSVAHVRSVAVTTRTSSREVIVLVPLITIRMLSTA